METKTIRVRLEKDLYDRIAERAKNDCRYIGNEMLYLIREEMKHREHKTVK